MSATLCYMTTISHREMRNNSAEILRRVEAGEEMVVTNHGHPVARLSPVRVSVIDDLIKSGLARPALDSGSWKELPPAVPTTTTSSELLADVRGYDRGY